MATVTTGVRSRAPVGLDAKSGARIEQRALDAFLKNTKNETRKHFRWRRGMPELVPHVPACRPSSFKIHELLFPLLLARRRLLTLLRIFKKRVPRLILLELKTQFQNQSVILKTQTYSGCNFEKHKKQKNFQAFLPKTHSKKFSKTWKNKKVDFFFLKINFLKNASAFPFFENGEYSPNFDFGKCNRFLKI